MRWIRRSGVNGGGGKRRGVGKRRKGRRGRMGRRRGGGRGGRGWWGHWGGVTLLRSFGINAFKLQAVAATTFGLRSVTLTMPSLACVTRGERRTLGLYQKFEGELLLLHHVTRIWSRAWRWKRDEERVFFEQKIKKKWLVVESGEEEEGEGGEGWSKSSATHNTTQPNPVPKKFEKLRARNRIFCSFRWSESFPKDQRKDGSTPEKNHSTQIMILNILEKTSAPPDTFSIAPKMSWSHLKHSWDHLKHWPPTLCWKKSERKRRRASAGFSRLRNKNKLNCVISPFINSTKIFLQRFPLSFNSKCLAILHIKITQQQFLSQNNTFLWQRKPCRNFLIGSCTSILGKLQCWWYYLPSWKMVLNFWRNS